MSTPAVVERYFEIVNTEDWAAMPGLFTPDAELRAVGAPVRRGPEEITAHFPWTLGALPVHHDAPTRVVTASSATHPVVLVEVHFTGRIGTGSPVEFDAVDVFDLAPDGASIARLSSWYDTAAVGAMIRGEGRGS